ncbi:NADPH:quinone reductase-like Zn-dependent oxidoreductase [Catalinimonas alkaloidigena]|uniref:NAD(P)-dependent alcohol dehydrogenase n=1 Tax=Catalinimonas alkaloidigena TaxID=1075417 RepID=UPI002406A2A3|nr:NAD(P)-dependent alcohol dehydrogenase [Catalinimonas alkaloidigena]MDF9796514.1 NADPH:quinone reductase-like Zn-dependent oxidoreductase [Catalinimonas alkaloidigena]
MKAIVYEKYGSPDLLELREVKRPEPRPHEVLIKVLAAAVNKADWHLLRGEPLPIRLMAGLFKPKHKIPGADVAGIVERVGSKITHFRPGDEVFGDLSGSGFGSFAEYVSTDEKCLAKKPSKLSYEESAALPMAAVTALQGLLDQGRVEEGQEVLINGASGGVGSYAIQLAKAYGAHVTAVSSTAKVEIAYQLGADEVIDYKLHDFIKDSKQYDLIFDVVGNRSPKEIERVLKPGGTYVSCAFSLGALLLGPWKYLTERKKMINLLASTNPASLQRISKLVEEEKLRPVIDKSFTLDDVPEALRIIGRGQAAGKLVIAV